MAAIKISPTDQQGKGVEHYLQFEPRPFSTLLSEKARYPHCSSSIYILQGIRYEMVT